MLPVADVRQVRPEDADAVLDLLTTCDIAELGESDCTLHDVQTDLHRPTYRGWVVDDPRGGLAAYLSVEHEPGGDSVNGNVMLRPGSAAADYLSLLELVRDAAAEVSPELPVRVFVATPNVTKATALVGAGAQLVRRFWRMSVDLDPQPPVVPAGGDGVEVALAKDTEADNHAMYDVLNTAFLDHFGGVDLDYHDWLAHEASGPWADRSLWWVARVEDAPAAALIGREWPDFGYVGALGSLAAHRGRGLGRLLLLTAFAEFHRRGQRRVMLNVDSENPTGAVGLYESVGMQRQHEWAVYELPPL